MAEAEIMKETTILLRLTEAEAKILKGLVQDPLDTGPEPREMEDFRLSIWKALNEVEF